MIVMLDQVVVVAVAHERGELRARPAEQPTREDKQRTGDITLASTHVFVPADYRSDRPAGVLVMLHGADGKPDHVLDLVRELATGANVIVIAPKSERKSWDMVGGKLGPDVARIDRAIAAVFAAYAIDPERLAIGGFSDGASYALTLGLANGKLFRTILAFSPGFQAAPRRQGKPRVFVAHGTKDKILPIERTSRRIVPALERRGFEVEFLEFEGGHTMPTAMLRRAFALLAATPAGA